MGRSCCGSCPHLTRNEACAGAASVGGTSCSWRSTASTGGSTACGSAFMCGAAWYGTCPHYLRKEKRQHGRHHPQHDQHRRAPVRGVSRYLPLGLGESVRQG